MVPAWPNRRGVNGHTARCTGPVSAVFAVQAGVWLRANGTEISAAQWAVRLGKDLTLSYSHSSSTSIDSTDIKDTKTHREALFSTGIDTQTDMQTGAQLLLKSTDDLGAKGIESETQGVGNGRGILSQLIWGSESVVSSVGSAVEPQPRLNFVHSEC